jgi:predicted AAA+ superfamily ATPase
MEYCACGGMPEVVSAYIEDGAFTNVDRIQQRIVADYREDIRKYAEGLDASRVVRVFDSIPTQLAAANKKFQLSRIAHGAKRKDYWGCVEWLNDAGVINLCHKITFPELPIKGNVDFDFYKIYMSDSGLLLSMIDEESRRDVLMRRNLGTWKGGFFENVVGEAIVKAGKELVYYKRDNSSLEMDFFIRGGDNIVPVEVKSENGQSKSLRTLIDSDHYPNICWGVKLINGNVGFENNILTLPHWCAFWLPRIVSDFAARIS